MARTAVVINEFGEISLDHALAATSDDTIMVRENGCLCCPVFGDLVATLNRLYYAREAGEIPPFDHVVIETSGLADPTPVIQAFLSDPTLAGLYRVGAVIATVDAVNGPDTLDRHVESVRQVALADHILLTKLDLVDAHAAKMTEAELRARLAHLNPAARIARIDDPALASFCFRRDEPTPREALRYLLDALQKNLGPNLLRVKGIIHVAEEPERPAAIQGAQQLLPTLSRL